MLCCVQLDILAHQMELQQTRVSAHLIWVLLAVIMPGGSWIRNNVAIWHLAQ